jgi:hypothetical protein
MHAVEKSNTDRFFSVLQSGNSQPIRGKGHFQEMTAISQAQGSINRLHPQFLPVLIQKRGF